MIRKAAIILGAGDATGGAIAQKFAEQGMHVAAVRRPRNSEKLSALADQEFASGGKIYAYAADAREETEVVDLFADVEANIGPIEVVIFNIGGNVYFPIRETTAQVYRKVWEMCSFAGFLAGREAAKHMVPRGRGSVFFTGATASIRGGSGFSAFASGKFALRALAQSMARELGPEGIHVAHLVVDSAIDTEWIAKNFPDRYALKEKDGLVKPSDIADIYWQLHCQPRSAWVSELDVRPYMESF
ncbi:SDR family oxidoreductase [Alphaproteobacteria bacterium]|nr:SDR family oxidoreductase [Alphaproteobacteria bacterium]